MMARLIFLFNFLLLTLASSLKGQDLEVGNSYIFTANDSSLDANEKMKLGPGGALPTSNDGSVQSRVIKGHKVKIERLKGDKVYFTYWNFPNGKYKEAYNEAGPLLPTRVFTLDQSVFEEITDPLFKTFRGVAFGTYTIPGRVRWSRRSPGKEDDLTEFDGNFDLNANLGLDFGLNPRWEYPTLGGSIGLGLTQVNLNESNSDLGSEDFANVDVLTLSAVTLTGGARATLVKNVSVGVFVGFDWLSSADQKTGWAFHDKAWLGFGLGVRFNSGIDEQNVKKATNEGD